MSHLNGIYEAHYQEVSSSSGSSNGGPLRKPGNRRPKQTQINLVQKSKRHSDRPSGSVKHTQRKQSDRKGKQPSEWVPARNATPGNVSEPASKSKGHKQQSRAPSSRSSRSNNAAQQQKRVQQVHKAAVQARPKSSRKHQRIQALCQGHQVAVLPVPLSQMPAGPRQPVCVVTPTMGQGKGKKLAYYQRPATEQSLNALEHSRAKGTGGSGRTSGLGQAAVKKPSLTPKSTTSQSSSKTLATKQGETMRGQSKKGGAKASGPGQGRVPESSKLTSSRQQAAALAWSTQTCYQDGNDRVASQGLDRQIPKRSRNLEAKGYRTRPCSKQNAMAQSQLSLCPKKDMAKVKTSRNQHSEKGNVLVSPDSRISVKSEKSRRLHPEHTKDETRHLKHVSPSGGTSKRSHVSKISKKSPCSCAPSKDCDPPRAPSGRSHSKSTSQLFCNRNPEKSPAEPAPQLTQESNSRSHSNKKKRRPSNQFQPQLTQTTAAIQSRLYNQLQKDNLQIQKQLMASKAELYEVKFKNKALKSKIEKFKKENEQEKNKRWLYQARCQKAGQLLQHSLSQIQVHDGQQSYLLSFVQQALAVLATGASTKSNEPPHVERWVQPQKRDVCLQTGPSLKEADNALLESSNEIKQQIMSSFKEPQLYMVEESKEDSASQNALAMRVPDIIYHTRDIVQDRERREFLIPQAINSDIQSEIYADHEEGQIQQVSRMFDGEISGSLSMSRKDQTHTEERSCVTSQPSNNNKEILPAHLMRVRDFEAPQSSDDTRDDAKATYQLQFNRPESSQRYERPSGVILNNYEIQRQSRQNTRRTTSTGRGGQGSAPGYEKGATGAAASSNYRDDVNSTLTMQNVLRPNNFGIASIAQSSQHASQPVNPIRNSGVQSNQGLGSSSSGGKPGSIRHQNIIQLLQQAAGSAGDFIADGQGMETIGQELNKLMKFGGTLPGHVQGKARSNNNFTLNTALATALIAASQTGTASGTNGLLKCLPLEDSAGSKAKLQQELGQQTSQLETQSIGTYAHLSQLHKQNLKHVQQLLQNSVSSTEDYGQTRDRCCSGQTSTSNTNTMGLLSAVGDTTKMNFLQLQQAAKMQQIKNESQVRHPNSQSTGLKGFLGYQRDGQQSTLQRLQQLSSSEKEASEVKPSDMFVEYKEENDPNLKDVGLQEESDDCSSSETEAGEIGSQRPASQNAESRRHAPPERQEQVFSDRSFQPPRPETVEDIQSPAATGSTSSPGPNGLVSGDPRHENIFSVHQRIERSLEEEDIQLRMHPALQQQEGIQIQIQKENLNEVSEEEPLGDSSYCAGFGGQGTTQQQLLTTSLPHDELGKNDSIMMRGHRDKLELKKQSQPTSNPYGRALKEGGSQQSLRSKFTDQKVKLLSNLYQCSEIEQQMSPANETDLTLLYHYNVFKGCAFAAAASSAHPQAPECHGIQDCNEVQTQGSVHNTTEGGPSAGSTTPVQVALVGEPGKPILDQSENRNRSLVALLQKNKSQASCDNMESEDSKRTAMKPMFNVGLEQNLPGKKDSVDCPRGLALLHPYSSMLETSLDNSQKIDKMFDDNNREDQHRRAESNQRNAEVATDVEKAQKKNLSQISHLSKITSHPSDNSQCLHFSKISRDADSFGAAVERQDRGRSKDGGHDSRCSPSPPSQVMKRGQEQDSAVLPPNRPRDQNSFSAAYGDGERDGAIHNDSSHLVNMASGATCRRNGCLSSEVSNLDRTSEVMANGDLQTRMLHIQQLYQNLIGGPGPHADAEHTGQPGQVPLDKSSELKEIEQIKLNLLALKSAQQEVALRNSVDSLSNPRHSQMTSNMFDNVTNTLTTLTSNVASQQTGQPKTFNKYQRHPQQKVSSHGQPGQSYADMARLEPPYNGSYSQEAKDNSPSPSNIPVENVQKVPRTASILQELSHLDKQIGQLCQIGQYTGENNMS